MPVTIQLLFNTPQREISSLIKDRLQRCSSAHLVSGFVTVDGVAAIVEPIRANPGKLATFVVGSGTYRAFEAFDGLIGNGVPQDRLFVHLGHTRPTGGSARHRFYRYHPMLHSKTYLMEMSDGTSCAFIGSHNMTCFAMLGLNGEAGVLLEGPTDSEEFNALRQHIDESRQQAVPYVSSMKEALSWWTSQFIEGLRDKANDIPRDGEAKKTIVVLSVKGDDPLPETGDLIYFEIPEGLGKITSLQAEVHIYVFGTKPSSPFAGLDRLDQARTSLWCQTKGLELEEGGTELKADWYIESKTSPRLLRAPRPFRPTPSPGMQQVRVKAWKQVYGKFEYLFGGLKRSWIPILEESSDLQLRDDDRSLIEPLDLIPPEDKEWYLVKDLRDAGSDEPTAYQKALAEASPESGSYVLISQRRRKKTSRDDH
jgi:HKD family nuclease